MGSNNNAEQAQRAAQQADADRRAAIAGTTSRINQVYDAPERQAQYSDFIGALRGQYSGDLGRQQTKTARQLKFSTARGGLTGGSADVTGRRKLGEEFTRGVLAAEDKAQGGLSALKAKDEGSRMNLIQLAQTGLDSTTAAARAAETAQVNFAGARGDSMVNNLGDMFANTTATYKTQQDAAARRAGQQAPVGSPYGQASVWSR